MQTTLTGKGPKCRVCTHPERNQIESLLARGAGISGIEPLMRGAFSRRALYRHRANHMISGSPAAHPVPFPHSASPLTRVKWLQREIEHTAALAEHQGDLSLKLKALHELERSIWLETRLKRGQQEPLDITPEPDVSPELLRRLEDAQERRRVALQSPEVEKESQEGEDRLQRAFRLSSSPYQRGTANDPAGNEPPSGSGLNR
jgi:hypothetical protein